MGLKQDLFYRVAKRWISGKDATEAVSAARDVNARGLGVVLNFLGEDVMEEATAERHLDEYLNLQQLISSGRLDGCVSVKLTQFGLGSDEGAARKRVRRVSENAAALGQFLWLDMERSKFTDQTISIYLELLAGNPNVGLAVQAYLRRSEADIERLLGKGAKVRLVKGAYREPPDVAYKSRGEISRSFSLLMQHLFERGEGFAIATHDSKLIDQAKSLASEHPVRFEFEMLKGIREDLKPALARAYRVVDYIPYGAEWYKYSMRRIKEHPSNIWLLLRSVF